MLFLQAVLIIFHKFGQTLVGQLVVDEFLQDLRRDRGDVRPGEHDAVHMGTAADAGGDDLRGQVVGAEHLHHVFHQFAAIFPDIVQAADEGAHVGGTGAGCQHGLSQAEDEGAVRPDAFSAQNLDGLQTFRDTGNLDDHVSGDFDEFPGFPYHAFAILADDFGADRTGDQSADFGNDIGLGTAGTGDQGGVRRHAVHDALVGKFLDFIDVGGVHKDLHCIFSFFLIDVHDAAGFRDGRRSKERQLVVIDGKHDIIFLLFAVLAGHPHPALGTDHPGFRKCPGQMGAAFGADELDLHARPDLPFESRSLFRFPAGLFPFRCGHGFPSPRVVCKPLVIIA